MEKEHLRNDCAHVQEQVQQQFYSQSIKMLIFHPYYKASNEKLKMK